MKRLRIPPNGTRKTERRTLPAQRVKWYSQILPLLFLCALTTSLLVQSEEKPWPGHLKNQSSLPKVVATQSDSASFTYESLSFRFISDKKLDLNKVREFAKTAESVPAVVARIPLPLLHMPVMDDGKKPAIYIFSDLESYARAGGSPQSAGYYSGRQKSVYLRASAFTEVKAGRTVRYNLLVHELTHLCNDGILGYVPPWFSEGNAEYISAAFIPKGSYQFASITDRIKLHAKRQLHKQKHIRVPKLEKFLQLSSKDWRELTSTMEPNEVYHLYCLSLMLVHHFYHRDPEGRTKAKDFIEACQNRKNSSAPYPAILTSNETQALEKILTAYWKPKGIIITFE